MKYRRLGRTGIEVSEIGLGLEHLLGKEQAVVTDTIRAAVKGGVNYLDCLSQTRFAGKSGINEDYVKLGNALRGIRDKVYITYIANAELSAADTQRDYDSFLGHLGTDYADIFMIACCDKTPLFEKVTGSDSLLTLAKKLVDEKKVKHIGLSTHSSDIAHKAIENGSIDVLMYPVNPAFDVVMDEEKYISEDLGKLWDAAYAYKADDSAGMKPKRKDVFGECARKQIGLVAMKPFAGGWLFRPDINTGFTPVNLISYALSQNGVSTVIPGCTSPAEIEEILTYNTCGGEARDYSRAVAESRWSTSGHCLYCNHCLPCAADINIAQINRLTDNYKDGMDTSEYDSLEVKASACIQCGECENRCPFGVEVIDKMKKAAEIFEPA